MNIPGGQTVSVYRYTRDRFGDAETETLVGTINHCVLQPSIGPSYRTTDDYRETSSLTSVLWAPRQAAVKLQNRDRVVLNDNTYQVVGNRAWDENHPVTGYDFAYYAVQLETAM